MSRVVDLTAGDSEGAEILERTGSGGVLGSAYLHDRPLASYIADEEAVKYVLRNKKSGLEVAGGADLATMSPDDDHQAFTVVTDVRLLFVVGSADGDRVQRLPLADVLTARAESGGLRTTVLRIETQDDAVVTFPVRGDVEAVAGYVDRAAQVWAHAARTAEEAADAVSTAVREIDAGNYESAQHAVAGVESNLEAALSDLRGLGQGALTAYLSTAEDLVDDVNGVRRRAHAGRGGAAHASAQTAWENREYEAAAGAYGDCIGAYAAAYQCTGDAPPDHVIRRRALGAGRERELLRSAPVIDLLTAKDRAAAERDPATAAETWERALEFARDLTALTWPDSDDRGFRLDSRTIRDHAADCAEHAIDNRASAARRWMSAGDRIAEGTPTPAATEAYERARIHLDRALALARELFPGRLDDLETSMGALEDRLSGSSVPGPGDHLDAPLPNEPIEALSHEPETVAGSDIDAEAASDDGRPADATAGAPDQDAAEKPAEPSAGSTDGPPSAEGSEGAAIETDATESGQAEGGTADADSEEVEPADGAPAEAETTESEGSETGPSPAESEAAGSTDPEAAPEESTPPEPLNGDWQVPPTGPPPADESAGEIGEPSARQDRATDAGHDPDSDEPDATETDSTTQADADRVEPPEDWEWHGPLGVDDADGPSAEVAGDSADSADSDVEAPREERGETDDVAEPTPVTPASADSDPEEPTAEPAEADSAGEVEAADDAGEPSDVEAVVEPENSAETGTASPDAEDRDVEAAMEATAEPAEMDGTDADEGAETAVEREDADETVTAPVDADDSDVEAAMEAAIEADEAGEAEPKDESTTVSPDAEDSEVEAALEGATELDAGGGETGREGTERDESEAEGTEAEETERDETEAEGTDAEETEAKGTVRDETSAQSTPADDSDVESAVAAAADSDDDGEQPERDADTDGLPSDETPATSAGTGAEPPGVAAPEPQDDSAPDAPDEDADEPQEGSRTEIPDQATLRRRLRALTEGGFTDLVADLWEAQGWTTMSFSASGGSVYDLVAVRGQPESERLLLWTDHRPDGGTVPVRVVERIEATRERSEGSEALALVTSGRITSEGRNRAEAADVDLYDAEAVVDALVEAGIADRLPADSD